MKARTRAGAAPLYLLSPALVRCAAFLAARLRRSPAELIYRVKSDRTRSRKSRAWSPKRAEPSRSANLARYVATTLGRVVVSSRSADSVSTIVGDPSAHWS